MTTPTPSPESAPRLPPTPLSQFVGRERELDVIDELVATSRLVTLTGAGGSGKTRLAREAAMRLAGRLDGVVWIDLAVVADADQVVQQVVQALGMSEQAPDLAYSRIRAAIGSRALLLVLDNCEHLVDASAQVAEWLLTQCPNVIILATSREALGVMAETAWLVPSLAMPEAVDLFVSRARGVVPNFTPSDRHRAVIEDICRRLDGIPLAIELAAARVRVLSLEQIAERLGNALALLSAGSRTAVPRHRTLRAAFDWSHSLLSEPEQILLRRLAVFPADFSLDAAEVVGSLAPLGSFDILDLLANLVDKSLVVLDSAEDEARYRLLETVRQYGLEHLEAAGEGELLRRRHAQYFLSIAEEAAPELFGGPPNRQVVDRLLAEVPNFHAVAEWSLRSEEGPGYAFRLVWALHWFWWSRGPSEENWRLAALLKRPSAVAQVTRVRAQVAFGHLALWQAKMDQAFGYLDEAMASAQDLDDDRDLLAYILIMRGAAKAISGQFDAAELDLERGVSMARQHSRTVMACIGCHFLALCADHRGDLDQAIEWHRRESVYASEVGHQGGVGHGLSGMALMLALAGRLGEALPLFRQSLGLHQTIGDGWGLTKGIEGVAACIVEGDPELSMRLLGAAEVCRERMVYPMWPKEAELRDRAVAKALPRVGDRLAVLWAEGRALSMDGAAALAQEGAAIGVSPKTVPLAPVLPPSAQQAAIPTPLVVHALGRLEVRLHGEPIDQAAWGSARARELLLLLLTNPRGLTKEQVGAALWPEASSAQLRNAFHVTLHRLRKALGGTDRIVSVDERYRLAPSLEVDFDAIAFDRQMTAALSAARRGSADAAGLLEQALALYRGPFLEGESFGDWALEDRDRIERLFVDGALRYAEWLL
ncbi:MAG: AAA family ATPase, partial [Gemmatimonadales bacterium]